MPEPYYSDDLVTLYHGDCREMLSSIADEGAGLVFTSPPYNQGATSGGYANMAGGYASYEDNLPMPTYIAWQVGILAECWRVLADDGAIFYNHKQIIRDGQAWLPTSLNPGLPLRQVIIWRRAGAYNWGERFFASAHEWIMLFAKPGFRIGKTASGFGDVWEVPQVNHHHKLGHPAPFPIQLPTRAIAAAQPSGPVLDPFAGIGTTLRAAKDLGRKSIGIEIDERYCEIAARRLAQGVLDFEADTPEQPSQGVLVTS